MTYKNVRDTTDAQKDAWQYNCYDLDTGKKILNVVWADDETGEYCVMLLDENGLPYQDGDSGEMTTTVKTGNIQLRKDG